MKKINTIIFLSALFIFSTSFMCAAYAGDAIENGGFENGINEFGICYSGRQDTALPSLYVTKEITSDGNYALELLPGVTLGTEESISPASDGFAYQGIYNKKSFSMESGKKYTISANVYPKRKNVKMRFMVFSDGKLLESSEEFTISADNWNRKDLKNITAGNSHKRNSKTIGFKPFFL